METKDEENAQALTDIRYGRVSRDLPHSTQIPLVP